MFLLFHQFEWWPITDKIHGYLILKIRMSYEMFMQNIGSILPTFFQFFSIKLDHFKVNAFFSYITNTQALQRKLKTKKSKNLV